MSAFKKQQSIKIVRQEDKHVGRPSLDPEFKKLCAEIKRCLINHWANKLIESIRDSGEVSRIKAALTKHRGEAFKTEVVKRANEIYAEMRKAG